MLISHRLPVNPNGQVHRYPLILVLVRVHVPPLKHGLGVHALLAAMVKSKETGVNFFSIKCQLFSHTFKKIHYIQTLTLQKYITYRGAINRPMRPVNNYYIEQK